ncbi:MAG: S8 family serine peptidase [Chitinophagaceae bacterium]|nr:S8 family serine peptidase [Chitinophagaceae bacterium]
MYKFPWFYITTAILLFIAGCQKSDSTENEPEPACEPVSFASSPSSEVYIVVLKDGDPGARKVQSMENARLAGNHLLSRYRIPEQQMDVVLNTVNTGFIARLTRDQAIRLKADDEVELVEQDRIITLEKGCFTVEAVSTVQWGVRRTGADDGTGKRVWIIDTGVDTDHPDLNVDITLSKCFITNETSVEDENGHGTHVAGIIGALNNSRGVLGVASGISIIALKALNNDGEGNTSGLIRALNYVGQNAKAGEVVNMSLGADTISNALDNAVRTLAEKGILFSIAAGNDAKKSILASPARVNHPNVFTVSAIDSLGRFATFSNFGNDAVDIAAPGVRIVSTFSEGRYARLSGTSMAAPHVAGILVLNGVNIKTKGTASDDPDGIPDPIISF